MQYSAAGFNHPFMISAVTLTAVVSAPLVDALLRQNEKSPHAPTIARIDNRVRRWSVVHAGSRSPLRNALCAHHTSLEMVAAAANLRSRLCAAFRTGAHGALPQHGGHHVQQHRQRRHPGRDARRPF